MATDYRRVSTGERVGAYTLGEKIGEGGMSVVYAARDDAGQACALKFMSREGVDDVNLQRLRREFEILSSIQHPNIVRVFDCGSHNGIPYLVMELVEGAQTLSEYL